MGTVRNARVNQGGPKCAGIVGLGLIGGSFARGYAQAGVRVLAWDPDDDAMTAASMGTVAGELNDETLGECDIIVLACYPEACIEWLEAHAQALADATDTEAIMGPVVIDTVGVKGIVCERAFELAREHGFTLWARTPWRARSSRATRIPAPTCSRAHRSCLYRPQWTTHLSWSFWARCARWYVPWALASSA